MTYIVKRKQSESLAHHGILGMAWGKRNGPPYPLGAGDHSAKEKAAGTKGWSKEAKSDSKKSSRKKGLTPEQKKKLMIVGGVAAGMTLVAATAYVARRAYVVKYVDDVLKAGTKLSTITNNATKDIAGKPFFAAKGAVDRLKYRGMYGGGQMQGIFGNKVYEVKSSLGKNIKIASQQSAVKEFGNLYNNNTSFKTAIKDMMDARKAAWIFRPGSSKQKKVLDNALNAAKKSNLTEKDINKIYEAFNYLMPNHNDPTFNGAKQTFFSALKSKGYGAIRDINDMKLSGYNTKNPFIIFDSSGITKEGVNQLPVRQLWRDYLGADMVRNGKQYAAQLGLLASPIIVSKVAKNNRKKQ